MNMWVLYLPNLRLHFDSLALSINDRIGCRPNLFEISESSVETLRPETEVDKIWNNCGDIYVFTWTTRLENSLRPPSSYRFHFLPASPIPVYLFSMSLEFSAKLHFHFPQPCQLSTFIFTFPTQLTLSIVHCGTPSCKSDYTQRPEGLLRLTLGP